MTVAPMEFRNSPSCAECFMDRVLRPWLDPWYIALDDVCNALEGLNSVLNVYAILEALMAPETKQKFIKGYNLDPH